MMTFARAHAPTGGTTRSGIWITLLLYSVLGVICLFSGFLIGTGQSLVLVLLMAMAVSIIMLAYPLPLIWLALLGALVISGILQMYVPGARPIRWAISMLGFALIASAILNRLLSFRRTSSPRRPFNSTLLWLGVFFAVALTGMLYSRNIATGLIGLKSYFQACGFFLALAWLQIPRLKVDQLMKSLVYIALIQFPFALHQFFFLGATRVAASAGAIVADAVVGTFAGGAMGGGAGPVLSALLITVICILIFWWRYGRLSLTKLLFMVSICLVPVLLNETKISFVLIPIALSLVFFDKLKQNPLQFLSGSIATVGLLAGLFMFYINLPAGSAYVQGDAADSIRGTIAYNIGEQGYGRSRLNRTTVYMFWAKEHGFGNPVETLIGHGMNASGEGGKIESSNLATVEHRGQGIGLTAISALLWDVGLLGALAVVAMFWTAFRLSGRLLEQSKGEDVIGDGLLMGARVGIAILGLNLIHNNYFGFEIGYQTLVMLMFGYVAYRAGNLADDQLSAPASALKRKRFRRWL